MVSLISKVLIFQPKVSIINKVLIMLVKRNSEKLWIWRPTGASIACSVIKWIVRLPWDKVWRVVESSGWSPHGSNVCLCTIFSSIYTLRYSILLVKSTVWPVKVGPKWGHIGGNMFGHIICGWATAADNGSDWDAWSGLSMWACHWLLLVRLVVDAVKSLTSLPQDRTGSY